MLYCIHSTHAPDDYSDTESRASSTLLPCIITWPAGAVVYSSAFQRSTVCESTITIHDICGQLGWRNCIWWHSMYSQRTEIVYISWHTCTHREQKFAQVFLFCLLCSKAELTLGKNRTFSCCEANRGAMWQEITHAYKGLTAIKLLSARR